MELITYIKDRFLTRILSFFRKIGFLKPIPTPGRLEWNLEDFKLGKGWAKSRPHPFDSKKTLWDYLTSEKDSTLVLHELNKAIRNEKNQKSS
jgi:hypothetical protein